jgi:RecA-family ATPase
MQWTVKGIMQRSTLSLWYGAPSSGKSFLVTDLGMAVARGAFWMGHRTRPGLVIYQTGEGGVGFRLRLNFWYRARLWELC